MREEEWGVSPRRTIFFLGDFVSCFAFWWRSCGVLCLLDCVVRGENNKNERTIIITIT